MRRFFTGLIGGIMMSAVPAFADDLFDADILSAETASFKVFDADGDGKASATEVVAGAKQVFAALDPDSSGSASPEEFQTFSMGFEPLANKILRRDEYKAARDAIFARWDMNGDQQLVQSEVVAALLQEFFTSADASIDQAAYAKSQFIAEMEAALKE